MKEITVTVNFKEGLHARPAMKFIKTAAKFDSDIKIEKKEKIVSAGSIMAVLGACIVCGDEITLRAEGTDEEEAIQALGEYFA